MNNYETTMRNGEKFFRGPIHSFSAKMLDEGGFLARIDSSNRTYFVTARVDEGTESVMMEIAPSIICSKESRSQVGEYIAKINSKYKCCNLRIASNGNIFIHAEQRFKDKALSVETFENMERESMKILRTFATILEKLSNMKLLEPEEADVEKVIEMNFIASLDMDSIGKLSFDDDDNDEDTEKVIHLGALPLPEPSGFSDWLRKRAEHGDLFAGEILAEKEKEFAKTETADAMPGSLLEKLLSIPKSESDNNECETDIDVLADI